MSILDDLNAAPKAYPYIDGRPVCGVKHAMLENPDLADEIAEAASRKDKTARIICNVLGRYGIELSEWQIRYHRRGACGCDR